MKASRVLVIRRPVALLAWLGLRDGCCCGGACCCCSYAVRFLYSALARA